MKADDLKFPYSWEARHPLLQDNVLFVPNNFEKHERINLFDQDRAVFIEYCSGNGAWITERAKTDKDVLWIAVEKRFDRVKKIWARMHNLGCHNLLIVCGDALTFTKHYLLSDCVDGIYVNFPDPWPKKKHAKNRLFQEPFVRELSRVVKKEGTAMLATDDTSYSEQMLQTMNKLWHTEFCSNEMPGYGASFFDTLWRAKGRAIHYLKFINRKDLC